MILLTQTSKAQEDLLKAIMTAVKGAELKEISLNEIDHESTIDIRVDRDTESDSQEVIKSVSNNYMDKLSLFIVMEVKDRTKYPIKAGKKYIVIDGKTRCMALDAANPNANIAVCVLPELNKIQQMYINLILNTKRANITEYARMLLVETYTSAGFQIPEIATMMGFSIKDLVKMADITYYPKETKERFKDGEISSRKLEESIGNIYSQPEIVEIMKTEDGKTFVDNCVNEQVERVIQLSLKRDTMATDKLSEKLCKHIPIGFNNGMTPKDIAEVSVPTLNGTYSNSVADLVCEHPTKIDAIEAYMNNNKHDFLVNLFCDPTVYDGNTKIKSIIERGVEQYGAEKCTGVSYFATNHQVASMKNLGIDVIKDGTKSDVYVWLSKQPIRHGNGLIIIDSYGSSKYNSKSFLEYLKYKFPESTILFLMLDQFNNFRNAGEAFVPTLTIMNWGIDPVGGVPELAEHFGFQIIWNDTVEVNELEDGTVDYVTVDGRRKKRGIYLLKTL